MERLTDGQREFAEKNYMLVLKYMQEKNLPIWYSDMYNGEDWYGVICIAFCKAVATYKEDLGYSFSTYAYFCMDNARKLVLRNASLKKSIPADQIMSLDMDTSKDRNGSKEDVGTLSDLIGSKSFEDDVITKQDFREFLLQLSQSELRILSMVMAGLKQKNIAEALGISQSYVSRMIKGIRTEWDKYSK